MVSSRSIPDPDRIEAFEVAMDCTHPFHVLVSVWIDTITEIEGQEW